jgi:hypothetical protein
MNLPFAINPAEVLSNIMLLPMEQRFNRYIDGRPWKRKTRSFKTNFRSGNKKKLRQFVK